jgi:hypothetical protein
LGKDNINQNKGIIDFISSNDSRITIIYDSKLGQLSPPRNSVVSHIRSFGQGTEVESDLDKNSDQTRNSTEHAGYSVAH